MTKIDDALVERMAVAISRHVAGKTLMFDNDTRPNLSVEAEFRAIVAELPAPVDPLLVEDRDLAATVCDALGLRELSKIYRAGKRDVFAAQLGAALRRARDGGGDIRSDLLNER